MSLLLFYIVALGASAIVLLLVTVTGFGATSLEYRILSGFGALASAAYAFYLVFQFQGGRYYFFNGALILPVYAGYKLYTGFRRRELDRADRRAAKAAQKAADEWRSTRRW
ncbi:hypothetical protein [Dactylosporangium sp. NPDC048998]|uniref:hypothetical protein n=1 Tax=Dactylosporangium sp. NPDC048998 TaxID=3363976 RepID=UPI00371C7421